MYPVILRLFQPFFAGGNKIPVQQPSHPEAADAGLPFWNGEFYA
jgi:hypothetical protein